MRRSTADLEAERDHAIAVGRGIWVDGTKTAQNILGRTEGELAALGRAAMARARPVVDAVHTAGEIVKAGARAAGDAEIQRAQAARAAAQQTVRALDRVHSALFEDHPPTQRPPKGPANLSQVDQRMLEIQNDLRRNLEGAAMTGYPEALAGAWPSAAASWLNKVRPGGAWDNKDKTSLASEEFQGNFGYGATAAALGLPKEFTLRGAGAVQRAQNVVKALQGKNFSPSVGGIGWPYGDDPRDQPAVAQGWDYGDMSSRRGR